MLTFLGEWFGEIFEINGKIWQTLLKLFRPGFIAKSYIDGKRNRFVSPPRLFLFAMLLAVFTLNAKTSNKSFSQLSQSIDFTMEGDVEVEAESEFEESMIEKSKEILELNPELRELKIRNEIFEAIPWILTGLLPLFALLLKLFFPRNYYLEHLVVALNLHTVFLLSLVFGNLLYTYIDFIGTYTTWAMVALVALHGVIALRVVYGGPYRHLLWRLPLLGIGYFCLLIVGLVGMMLLVFWKM